MTQPPRIDVTSVTIGAPAPRELAAFYARMLDWPIAAKENLQRDGQPGVTHQTGQSPTTKTRCY
jgi:hypothetical protein